jgi:RHS repeat-associated protein
VESGLYYLQSRYYNPDWGRFISEDIVDNDGVGTLMYYNLYAYCKNNSVNTYDPSGYNEQPLNDGFLKNKDGSYKTGKELDDLYKSEKDPAKKAKIKKQQKIFGQRDKQKRAGNEKSKGKSRIDTQDVAVAGGITIIIGGIVYVVSNYWWVPFVFAL